MYTEISKGKEKMKERQKVEFIESYIRINDDYQWCDNHGELIRCKDCRFFHPRSVYGHGLCDVHCNGIGESEVVRGTYFCADAERKSE